MELESAPPGDVADGSVYTAAEWTLSFLRDAAFVQFSGNVQLVAEKQRSALGNEAASVQAMFAIRRAADWDMEVAGYLSEGDRVRAKDVKSQQIGFLRQTLDAVRAADSDPVDVQVLEAVLRRAEIITEQLDAGHESELVRRRVVQDHDLNRAMSVGSFDSGSDSSGPDDHLQRRLRDFDDNASVGSDGSHTSSPTGSPRWRPASPPPYSQSRSRSPPPETIALSSAEVQAAAGAECSNAKSQFHCSMM